MEKEKGTERNERRDGWMDEDEGLSVFLCRRVECGGCGAGRGGEQD